MLQVTQNTMEFSFKIICFPGNIVFFVICSISDFLYLVVLSVFAMFLYLAVFSLILHV